ncbi:MAG: formylmethanofuran dehydrogenase subunit C [Pseudomonadota bacterium]
MSQTAPTSGHAPPPRTAGTTGTGSSTRLRLRLRHQPPVRLDMSAIVPERLQDLALSEMASIPLAYGPKPIRLGDIFDVDGDVCDGHIVIEGSHGRLDRIAAGLSGGTIRVEGAIGHYGAHRMTGGEFIVSGDAGHHLASSLVGGLVHVMGHAGDHLGAPSAGERDGISGGVVIVEKDAGAYCSERQRRGLVLIKGRGGAFSGGRMLGGTLWSVSGFGAALGCQMRRGTIITPDLTAPLSTFRDCGKLHLPILPIMASHYAHLLGDRARRLPTGAVQRYVGDFASIGRGEILAPAE